MPSGGHKGSHLSKGDAGEGDAVPLVVRTYLASSVDKLEALYNSRVLPAIAFMILKASRYASCKQFNAPLLPPEVGQ